MNEEKKKVINLLSHLIIKIRHIQLAMTQLLVYGYLLIKVELKHFIM